MYDFRMTECIPRKYYNGYGAINSIFILKVQVEVRNRANNVSTAVQKVYQ